MYIFRYFPRRYLPCTTKLAAQERKKQRMFRLCILNNFNNFVLKRTAFKATSIHAEKRTATRGHTPKAFCSTRGNLPANSYFT